MKLTDRTILITGGTSGIGLGLAKEFLKRGNRVIICGRRFEKLKEIKAEHDQIETVVCDLIDERQRISLYQQVRDQFPDTDILLNNAGIQLRIDLTRPVNPKEVAEEIETNLIAPIHLSSLFVEHLSEKTQAAIINISSGLAYTPISWMPVYCASKAAMHSWSLSLRHQLRRTPIMVFEIAPPAVDTELGSQHREDKPESHGGMSVTDFVSQAISAIESDSLETAIGLAQHLRDKREELFVMINPSS